jgi:3-oxoacyl-[acyl-carrier-protein] synthase III
MSKVEEILNKIETKDYVGKLHPDYKTILDSIKSLEELQTTIKASVEILAARSVEKDQIDAIIKSATKLDESIRELELIIFMV